MDRRWFWNRSLTARLVLSFLVLSLVIVSLVGAIAYIQATQYLTDSVYGRLDSVATLKETGFNNWVDDQTQNVVMLAWLPEIRSNSASLTTAENSSGDRLRHYQDVSGFLGMVVSRSPYADELYLIDPNGTIIVSTDKRREGSSVATERYFLEGISTTVAVTQPPVRPDETTAVIIGTPVFDMNGRRTGVLATHLSLSRIDRVILDRTGLGKSGETYLVDRSSRIVSETPLMQKGISQQPVSSAGIGNALSGKDGSGLYANYNGVPVIGVYRWIDNHDMALVAEMSQDEAFRPARELALSILYTGIALSLLLAAGMYLLARQITRPIKEISRTAALVSAGDLGQQAPVLTGDEVGTLAVAFNDMTGKLRTTLQGLEENLRVLEERDDELRKSERKYRDLVENIPQKIFRMDRNLVYISCNANYAADLHIRADEIAGKTDLDFFPPQIAEKYRSEDSAVLSTGRPQETVEPYLQDGKTRWINAIRTPVRDPDGTITGIQCIFWDITDKKNAEEELRRLYSGLEARVEERTSELRKVQEAYLQANAKLNLLSSITRHDILNQLMVLKGYLELMQMPGTDPAAVASYTSKVQQVADIIEHQILFTGEYQDIGVKSPAWQSVSLSIIHAKGALDSENVEVRIERSDLEVWADPLFDKVFYNLLDNALLYGGRQLTRVSVSSFESGGSLVIVFEDNGAGLSAQDRAHLFERGFGKHTGLGLCLSREILHITGITIAEKSSPGAGARFEITVPAGNWRYAGPGGSLPQ